MRVLSETCATPRGHPWDYVEVLAVIAVVTVGGWFTPLNYHAFGYICPPGSGAGSSASNLAVFAMLKSAAPSRAARSHFIPMDRVVICEGLEDSRFRNWDEGGRPTPSHI